MTGERRVLTFLVRRTLQAIPLVAGIITLTFILIHSAPGDPVYLMAGDGGDAAYYSAMRARYGLDRPLPEQYLHYVRSVLSGDFGFSYGYQQPVFGVIRDRIPATLALSLPAFAIASILGIVVGLAGAAARGSRLDVALRLMTSTLYSAPVFWVGQILLLLFAVLIPIFPVGGMRSLRESTQGSVDPLDLLWHLVLPCASLSFSFLAIIARVTRASVIAETRREYVRAARARGLTPAAVLLRHAVPNALLPIVTVAGYQVGLLLTSASLTEAVFGWPGLGELLLDASAQRDYPLIIAILLTASIVVVAANVVTDVVYTAFDPRVEV